MCAGTRPIPWRSCSDCSTSSRPLMLVSFHVRSELLAGGPTENVPFGVRVRPRTSLFYHRDQLLRVLDGARVEVGEKGPAPLRFDHVAPLARNGCDVLSAVKAEHDLRPFRSMAKWRRAFPPLLVRHLRATLHASSSSRRCARGSVAHWPSAW